MNYKKLFFLVTAACVSTDLFCPKQVDIQNAHVSTHANNSTFRTETINYILRRRPSYGNQLIEAFVDAFASKYTPRERGYMTIKQFDEFNLNSALLIFQRNLEKKKREAGLKKNQDSN